AGHQTSHVVARARIAGGIAKNIRPRIAMKLVELVEQIAELRVGTLHGRTNDGDHGTHTASALMGDSSDIPTSHFENRGPLADPALADRRARCVTIPPRPPVRKKAKGGPIFTSGRNPCRCTSRRPPPAVAGPGHAAGSGGSARLADAPRLGAAPPARTAGRHGRRPADPPGPPGGSSDPPLRPPARPPG